PQPKQWPSHSTFMGRTIPESRSRRPHLASPRGGEGQSRSRRPHLPPHTVGGGTCSHFPENQALQFHAPVRCSALPLPESALVRSASTVPVCPDRSRVKTTLSDAEVFCQTCT